MATCTRVASLRALIVVAALALFAPSASRAGSEDVESAGANPYVTCGSVIKLRASQLGTRITCQEVAYGGGGSGQSAVTGTGSSPNAFSYWQVRGAVGEDCMQGARLAKGSRIRLQSVSRKQWLHSHHIRSMLSNHQEVSCFGSETESDDSEVWIVGLKNTRATHWRRDEAVTFRHEVTKVYLTASSSNYPQPLKGEKEICGASRLTTNAYWVAEEGVYFPMREIPPASSSEHGSGKGGRAHEEL